MNEFAEVVKTFGWPGALLVLIGIVGWRMCVFLHPYVVSIFDKHVEFVETATQQTHNQTDILNQMSVQQTAFIGAMGRQHVDKIDLLKSMQHQHEETNELIREMHSALLGAEHRHTVVEHK